MKVEPIIVSYKQQLLVVLLGNNDVLFFFWLKHVAKQDKVNLHS